MSQQTSNLKIDDLVRKLDDDISAILREILEEKRNILKESSSYIDSRCDKILEKIK